MEINQIPRDQGINQHFWQGTLLFKIKFLQPNFVFSLPCSKVDGYPGCEGAYVKGLGLKLQNKIGWKNLKGFDDIGRIGSMMFWTHIWSTDSPQIWSCQLYLLQAYQ